LKIAIISDYIDSADWGGAARVAVEQAFTLKKMNHDVVLIAPSRSGNTLPNINHIHWSYKRSLPGVLKFRNQLAKHISKFSPDLTILHQPLSGLIFQNTFPQKHNRYFFHSSWIDELISLGRKHGIKLKAYIEKKVVMESEKVFVTSSFSQSVLKNHVPSAVSKAIINPLGVRSPPFEFNENYSNSIFETYNIPKNHKIVSVFRRLIPRTGVSLFINAFAKCSGMTALIGGIGEMQNELIELTKKLNIEDNIRFLGYLGEDSMIKILQGADVSVVPSLELEGFGLSTVEAMACGCPVVATPVGNNPDLINTCNGGVISEDRTEKALADALILCLEKNWDKKFLSERTLKKYNWHTHAQALIS